VRILDPFIVRKYCIYSVALDPNAIFTHVLRKNDNADSLLHLEMPDAPLTTLPGPRKKFFFYEESIFIRFFVLVVTRIHSA